MSAVRHLSSAPIVEALINYQASAAAGWQPDQLKEKFTGAWPSHTEIQDLREVSVEVSADATKAAINQQGFEGYIFRSPTVRTVHQVRRGGYTFSRLEPYENWGTLVSDANQGWETFKSALSPQPLHAVAVRFINKLVFERDGFKVGDFLTTPPVPPAGLAWRFHAFNHFTVYAIPDSPCAVHVRISKAFDPAMTDHLAFFLDIEVQLKEPLSSLGRSLHDILREMHQIKNEAFFSLLTERALKRYL